MQKCASVIVAMGHGTMLKGDNEYNLLPCVYMGVRETWEATCPLNICVHVCVGLFPMGSTYALTNVSVHPQPEHPSGCNAMSTHKAMLSAYAVFPLGMFIFLEKAYLSGWKSPSASCTVSPLGLCFSFLAFPQIPSLTAAVCPVVALPCNNTQPGNPLPCSSPVSSHIKSQKEKKTLLSNLSCTYSLQCFCYPLLVLRICITNLHPNSELLLQTRLEVHIQSLGHAELT